MPTCSPTSPGLGVQVIRPSAISPELANKLDNHPQPVSRRERRKEEGDERNFFFYAEFKDWQPEGRLQAATPNTPARSIIRVDPFCHTTLATIIQGNRGYLCGPQPEQGQAFGSYAGRGRLSPARLLPWQKRKGRHQNPLPYNDESHSLPPKKV